MSSRLEQFCISEGLLHPGKVEKYNKILAKHGANVASNWLDSQSYIMKHIIPQIYRNARTFEEILDASILHIEGKTLMTWNRFCPNNDFNIANLILIHKKLGFFVMDGQSGDKGLLQEDVLPTDTLGKKALQRKAYLQGIILKESALKIIDVLKNDHDVYCTNYQNDVIYNNIDEAFLKCYHVTLDQSESRGRAWPLELYIHINDEIDNIISDKVFCEIQNRCYYILIIAKNFIDGDRIENNIVNRIDTCNLPFLTSQLTDIELSDCSSDTDY